MHTRAPRRAARRGFTLIEVLIVVVILGILAVVVVPQFSSASADARISSGKSMIQTIRSQIELYKLHHKDEYPTSNGEAGGTFEWELLTGTTDDEGNDGSDYGPYLQQVPKNPWTTKSDVAATNAENVSFVWAGGKLSIRGSDGTLYPEEE